MNGPIILKAEGLEVRYDDFLSVKSASLAVRRGGVAALVGANGAGKSTLLNTIAGLRAPSAGAVFFDGEDITAIPADQVAARGLSLVPQGGHCFLSMSVQDNLMMGSYPARARKQAKQSLEYAYYLFPALGRLSGGQRQMLAIGRVLMAKPACILFDEISAGLAPSVTQDLYACIRKINREEGVTILLVEQDTRRALAIAEFCHVMFRGCIMLSCPSEKLDGETLRKVYFGI